MDDLRQIISVSLLSAIRCLASSNFSKEKCESFNRDIESILSFFNSGLFQSGNKVSGKLVMDKVLYYSQKLERLLTETSENIEKDLKEKIEILIDKLKYLFDCIPAAFQLNEEDLSCLSEDHERKVSLRSITTTITHDNKEEIRERLSGIYVFINRIKAAMYLTNKYNLSISRNLMTGWLLFYYSFSHKKAQRQAALFDIYPSPQMTTMYLNITESKFIRKIISYSFPKIQCSQMIFVPKLSKHILDDSIQDLNTCITEQTDGKGTYTLHPDGIRIPIRVLSKLPLPNLSPAPPQNSPSYQCENLLINIHGGGFAASSSYSNQSITRKWAIDLGTPIFSIDYRLAPEHPFPAGLDDVWQAYTWLVTHSQTFLGKTPTKIVLVGDSAGGTLVTAITIKAITSGFRQPDGILLINPLLSMQHSYFSTSSLLALEDLLLPYRALQIMARLYVRDMRDLDRPLVSPVLCGEEILGKFRRTEIMIPQNDSLARDSSRFAEKLLRAGGKVHISEFPGVVHGALFFTNKESLPLFDKFGKLAVDLLRSMLE